MITEKQIFGDDVDGNRGAEVLVRTIEETDKETIVEQIAVKIIEDMEIVSEYQVLIDCDYLGYRYNMSIILDEYKKDVQNKILEELGFKDDED